MNDDEKVVSAFLKQNYHKSVVYEPDGNTPPDFRLGEEIAIEVRRLNQNYFKEDEAEGLEELRIPFFEAFREVLDSFGEKRSNSSYLVGISFERPLEFTIPEFKVRINECLEEFLDQRVCNFPWEFRVSKNLTLEIYQSISKNANLFSMLGGMDKDTVDWVIPAYIKNLRHCILEKTEKVNGSLPRYDHWWLFLVDRIMFGLDEVDLGVIRKHILNSGNFEKVSLIRSGKEIVIIEST